MVTVERSADEEWAAFAVDLARNLQRIRVMRGYSQDQVAYATGLSRSSYQRLERGENFPGSATNPTLRNLMALAQVLEVSLDELVPQPWPEVRAGHPLKSKQLRQGR